MRRVVNRTLALTASLTLACLAIVVLPFRPVRSPPPYATGSSRYDCPATDRGQAHAAAVMNGDR